MKDNNKQKEMGKMPKDWDSIKLGESNRIELIMGQSPPSSSYNEKRKGLPFLQGSADFRARYPYINKYTSQPMKIAEKNDVLISVRAPVGDVNIAPVKLCIGRGLAAIRVNEGNNLFYFYWIQKVKNKLAAIGAGSTFKAVTKNELYNFEIPILPLKEEQKIAEILSTADEGIQKVDELIMRTERLKKGLMQNLLTKGIGHKEFKDTKIGRIPEDWGVVKLMDIAKIYDYKRVPLSEIEREKRKGLFPYCGANGIIDYINDYIFDGEFILLAEDGGDYRKFKQSAYIMNGKFWVNNHAHILSAILEKTSNMFLLYSFNFYNLMPYIVGSTRKKLNQDKLKQIDIPLPLLSEQQKIAEILSTVDKKIELQRKRKEKLERIKKSLMNDLLSGKRRVRIG
ncbi:MAG: restriction endonuclease subunit S [Promethearchaeota archaeon]